MSFLVKFTRKPLILIIVIMIVYVAFAFYADIGKLSRTTLRIDYLAIPLIVAPMTTTILLLALRFNRFLRALNIKISIKKSILIYIAGLSLAVTPGSSGQIIKSQIMKKQFDHAISKTSPIIFIEKWSELTSVLLILIVFAVLNAMWESILITVIGIGVAILLFGVMTNQALFGSFKKIVLKIPRLKIFEESLEISQGTLKALSSKKVVVEGIIITIPAMIFQAISVYFAFHALGIKVAFVLSTQIFYVSLISGILSFLPGGLGVTEGSMAALLLKYYNHDIALLAGAVILVRLVTLWYPTFLGIIIGQLIMKYKMRNGQE
jgi:glycosyltransferase 2 family protein